MPIGATIGAGVITAGAGIYSGSQAARAQTRAANTAADTSLATTNANNQLFRETRNQNLQIASPFYNNGLLAGNALTDLLLGTNSFNPALVANPTVPGGGTFSQFPPGSTNEQPPFTQAQINAMWNDGIRGNAEAAQGALNAWNASHPGGATTTSALAPNSGGITAPVYAQEPVAGAGTVTTPAPATGGGAAAPASALSAWDQFRQGTNYNWRFNEGNRALTSNAAARGMGDSGAERTALLEYGQNFASNELSNYMNLLAGQQASGLTAAGAVMGVSTNYAGNVAAGNTNAGNAAANAALVGGQAQANQWGNIGSSIGQAAGALSAFGGAGGFGGGNIYASPNPTTQSALAIGNWQGGF